MSLIPWSLGNYVTAGTTVLTTLVSSDPGSGLLLMPDESTFLRFRDTLGRGSNQSSLDETGQRAEFSYKGQIDFVDSRLTRQPELSACVQPSTILNRRSLQVCLSACRSWAVSPAKPSWSTKSRRYRFSQQVRSGGHPGQYAGIPPGCTGRSDQWTADCEPGPERR